MEAQPGDLPLAHGKNEPEVAFDRNAAALSAGCLMNLDQDVISCIEELLSGGGPIFKVLSPVGRRLKEAFLPVINGVIGLDAVCDQVISHQVDHVADVAPLKRRESPAHGLDVLLRHRHAVSRHGLESAAFMQSGGM